MQEVSQACACRASTRQNAHVPGALTALLGRPKHAQQSAEGLETTLPGRSKCHPRNSDGSGRTSRSAVTCQLDRQSSWRQRLAPGLDSALVRVCWETRHGNSTSQSKTPTDLLAQKGPAEPTSKGSLLQVPASIGLLRAQCSDSTSALHMEHGGTCRALRRASGKGTHLAQCWSPIPHGEESVAGYKIFWATLFSESTW